MQVKDTKISEIKTNPNNPRLIKDDKFAKLVKSIKEFPEMLKLRPIVVNDDMIVIGGNMRLKACKEAGLKVVPVIKASELSEEQQRRFIISDNVGFGEWDWEMLGNEWEAEQLEEWGLDLPDMSVTELEAEEDNYDVPDGGIETDIVPGDLFEIGAHRLLCGDSTDSDAVARLMNGKTAEMLFTSPPYSDMREYNGSKDLSVDNISDFIPTWYGHAKYQVINLGIQRKENEIIPYWDTYINKANACGYKLMAWNVWHKSSVSVGNQIAFIPIYHEWVFVFGEHFKHINRTWERKGNATKAKSRKVRQPDGTMKASSIGDQQKYKEMESVIFTNTELGEIRKSHPATFPIELPSEYVQAMTDISDIVAESFTGSGSTMVAAHQLKRKCYGMELDPKYCQVIVDRMIKLDPSLIIKRNGTPYETKTT